MHAPQPQPAPLFRRPATVAQDVAVAVAAPQAESTEREVGKRVKVLLEDARRAHPANRVLRRIMRQSKAKARIGRASEQLRQMSDESFKRFRDEHARTLSMYDAFVLLRESVHEVEAVRPAFTAVLPANLTFTPRQACFVAWRGLILSGGVVT